MGRLVVCLLPYYYYYFLMEQAGCMGLFASFASLLLSFLLYLPLFAFCFAFCPPFPSLYLPLLTSHIQMPLLSLFLTTSHTCRQLACRVQVEGDGGLSPLSSLSLKI